MKQENKAVLPAGKGSPATLRKKPWNRVNLPVYSISSTDGHDHHNMHIITYVTAISMQPKRFVCGIYQGTQTLRHVLANPHFVLQLLAAHQYRLTDLLGKRSGATVNKISRLQKRNELTEWNGFKVLQHCLALMEMKVVNILEGGDHTIFVCDVINYKNLHAGEALTLDILRKHKLIRI